MAFFKKSKDKGNGSDDAPPPPPPPQPAPRPVPKSAPMSAAESARAARTQPSAPPNPAMAAAAKDATAEVDVAAVQKNTAQARKSIMALGEVMSVLMRSPQYRTASLAALQGVVAPAIAHGQFLVANAQLQQNGPVVPVAVVLWASVSEEVDRRLSQNLEEPAMLKPDEWRSGDIPWLIVFAGDQRAINQMLQRLEQRVLKGRPIKVRAKDNDGKTVIRSFRAAQGAPADAQTAAH